MSVEDFFFEIGMLNRLKRSGFSFLGSGDQSVSEHSYRTAIISYYLAGRLKADVLKVLLMSLFHDVCEARTGDMNYVNKIYARTDEKKAVDDMLEDLPFRDEIRAVIYEFNQKESMEARICMDADQLEMILSLKEELDKGNLFSQKWFKPVVKRLILPESREIADIIMHKSSYDWWMKLL